MCRISHFEYRTADVIGRGSKSIVYAGNEGHYAGVDVQSKQRVAIKHVNMESLDDLSRWLLHNEKRALMRLRHPNVIKLVELV